MVAMPLVCSSCDTGIAADEIVAGLAVRIDGQFLCATCIETLPDETRRGIEQMRAQRIRAVTTYRVRIARLPRTALFTFTTASQLNVNRRELMRTGVFEAPPLPEKAPSASEPRRTAPAPVPPSAPSPSPARRRPTMLLGLGAGVLVLGGIAAAAVPGRGSSTPAPQTAGAEAESPQMAAAPVAQPRPGPAPSIAAPAPVVPQASAPAPAPADIAAAAAELGEVDDPLSAWTAARATSGSTPARLAALAQLVSAMRSEQLDAAERAIVAGRAHDARMRLAAMRVPKDPAFADLVSREASLTARLAEARPTSAGVAPAPAPPATALSREPDQPVAEPEDGPAGPVSARPLTPPPSEPADALEPGRANATEPAGPVHRREAEHPEPATALPAAPAPATPAAAPTIAVADWVPSFAFPERASEEPRDGTSALPTPWPLGSGYFYRSAKMPGSRRTALALRIPAAAVASGGVSALIHRGAPTRSTLTVTLQVGSITTPLGPLQLEKGWQQVAFALGTVRSTDGDVVLRLEDADDRAHERGFVLAKATLVSGRLPSPDDLALQAPPLLGDDPLLDSEARTRFRALIAKVQQRRNPRMRAIAVSQLTLVVADLDAATEQSLIPRFVPVIARDLERQELVRLEMTATAWEDQQFTEQPPRVDPDKVSLVLFCPNGREVAALQRPDAFAAWLQRQLGALSGGDAKGRRGGFFPIAVMGPLAPSSDPGEGQRIADLWSAALADCERLGIPVLDIRVGDITKPEDRMAEAGRRLAEGLRMVHVQLAASQRTQR